MEEHEDGGCNTRLSLGLGIGGGYVPKEKKKKKLMMMRENNNNQVVMVGPSFELGSPIGDHQETINYEEQHDGLFRIKRIMDHDHDNSRKKLRLSKDQSALLEETFKLHPTLNPAQKHSLAEKLNLRPRQVEVWFQNRRARTKLKQTEIDCEFLRKCCENLRGENQRLKKELQELRSHMVGLMRTRTTPFYVQLSKTTAPATATCSSCQKPFNVNDANNNNNRNNNNKLQSLALDCYVG